MNMIPQIIYLICVIITLITAMNDHGKTGIVDCRTTFIGIILALVLLFWGGFFDVFFK